MYRLRVINTYGGLYLKLIESATPDYQTGFERQYLKHFDYYNMPDKQRRDLAIKEQLYISFYINKLNKVQPLTARNSVLLTAARCLWWKLYFVIKSLQKPLPVEPKRSRKTGISSNNLFFGSRWCRAANHVIDIIVRNLDEDMAFITLTYEKEPDSYKEALQDLRLYVRRMRRLCKQYKYIAVPELSKKGRFHWHICQKGENIHQIQNKLTWKLGVYSVEDIEQDPNKAKNFARYLTKNFSKIAEHINHGKKLMIDRSRSYYASKGWKTDFVEFYLTKEQAEIVQSFMAYQEVNNNLDSYHVSKVHFTDKEQAHINNLKIDKGILSSIESSIKTANSPIPDNMTLEKNEPDLYVYSGILNTGASINFLQLARNHNFDGIKTFFDGSKSVEARVRKLKAEIICDVIHYAKNGFPQYAYILALSVWLDLREQIKADIINKLAQHTAEALPTNFTLMEELEEKTSSLKNYPAELQDALTIYI